MIATLALLAALRADPDAAGCRPDELQAAAKSAQISELGRANGADVVLAGPHAACLCGNVNCPWYVLRLAGSPPAVLLQTFGYAADTVAAGGTLPGLRVTSHDSALISYETDYAYRDGAYVAAETWIVRGDTGVRKRVDVPVQFAPGTSSATLHGSTSISPGRGARERVSLSVDSVRPSSATAQPAFANASAVARPTPVPAPVTIALWFMRICPRIWRAGPSSARKKTGLGTARLSSKSGLRNHRPLARPVDLRHVHPLAFLGR